MFYMQLCQPPLDYSMTITRLEQLIARNSSEGKLALSARIKFDQLHSSVKGSKLQASEKRVRGMPATGGAVAVVLYYENEDAIIFVA